MVEVVARFRSGTDRVFAEMFGIVGAAAHITHRFVGREHGQHIDVGVKTSRIGCCHSGSAWVGDHIAVPVSEVVASSRRCRDSCGASSQSGNLNAGTWCCGLRLIVGISVVNFHRAAPALALSHGCAHYIVVDAEEGLGGGVARHGEGERRKGGELVGTRHRIMEIGGGGERIVVLVLPTADEIQRVGRGVNRHLGAVIYNVCVGTAARNHSIGEAGCDSVARTVIGIGGIGDSTLDTSNGHFAAGVCTPIISFIASSNAICCSSALCDGHTGNT